MQVVRSFLHMLVIKTRGFGTLILLYRWHVHQTRLHQAFLLAILIILKLMEVDNLLLPGELITDH